MKNLLTFLLWYTGVLLGGILLMPLMILVASEHPSKILVTLDPIAASIVAAFAGLWILISVFILEPFTKKHVK